MKILVIQQKMIGDVLATSIICNNLRTAYPDAQIDYLVYETTIPVLEGNKSIDNLILFTDKHRKSTVETLKLAFEIRREKYDLLIDAYSKLESWLFVLISGAEKRISYKKQARNFLYTDNIPFAKFPDTNMGLAIERRLSLLKPLNLAIKLDPYPKLFLSKEEKKAAAELLESFGIFKDQKTIMISLLGSDNLKTYPLEYMSVLIDHIADQFEATILFNYFPKQLLEATTVFDSCSKNTQEKIKFNLLGSDLRGFIAIMNACDLIIGNDGGAINIAKALNKPSFIIFSPWIEKKIWSTFEDGVHHYSVHLIDFSPELFENFSEKELKIKTPELYSHFKPELFTAELTRFLQQNLNCTSSLNFPEIIPVKLPLSALIITYNEEKHIEKVLENLDFADEIIVVDSYSSDKTESIIRGNKRAKLIQHPFVDYSSQRNFAIDCASNPWILFLDADELITPELKAEIIETVLNKNSSSAYLFYRTFMFKNVKLNFSGWQTDKIFRLFKKDKARYVTERLVHEKLTVNGTIGKLKNKLIHFSFSDYQSYKNKMICYGKFKAEEAYLKNTKPNFLHLYLHPCYTFLYQYFIRLGILDGRKGIIICYLNALSVWVRFRELKNKISNTGLLPKL